MKKHMGWAHRPYQPLFEKTGLYLCRIVPAPTEIRLFWLPANGVTEYTVYCKKRESDCFEEAGTTALCSFTLTDLEEGCDYAFYVCGGGLESRVRLARTGTAIGTVVNYLHPEDEAYAFSGRFLCSPTLTRYPDGYLLATMDLFEGGGPQNLTLIFGSSDQGATWSYVSELFPAFWSRPFLHRGVLYVLSCSTEYGDLLIGASHDRGKTFTEPTVLLRGSNGKKGNTGIHKNPQPVVEYNGRIYNTFEWGSWSKGYHAPAVMSADINADLLDAGSWSFSDPLPYDDTREGLPRGKSNGNIEGCLTVCPDGQLYNIMRYDMRHLTPNYGLAVRYLVDTEHPEEPLIHKGVIPFPANHSKFEIKWDPASGFYYTVCTRISCAEDSQKRTLLSLMRSRDTQSWELMGDLYDFRAQDPEGKSIGLQYVDFFFEGDELVYLCRTAMNGAMSFHNSNYITFHRLPNFRSLGQTH